MKTLSTLVVLLVVLVASVSAEHKCKYERQGKWSECENGKQTVTKVRQEGSDELCPPKKVKTRICVPGCHYDYKTHYGKCNETTYTRSRVLNLKKAVKDATCEEELKDTVPCKGKCKYSKAQYGKCDAEKKTKTKVRHLISGNKDMCDPERTQTKKCIPGKHGHGHNKHGRHGKHGGEKTGGENM